MASYDESSKPRKSTLSWARTGVLVLGTIVAVKGEQRKYSFYALISNTNKKKHELFMRPVGRVWKPVAGDNGRITKSRVFREAREIRIGAVHIEESESFRVASSPLKMIH